MKEFIKKLIASKLIIGGLIIVGLYNYHFRIPVMEAFDSPLLVRVVEDTKFIPDGAHITLEIGSNGGYVPVLYRLINYLHSHHYKLTCSVSDSAYSAGAILVSTCDNVDISDNAKLLFHLPAIMQKQIDGTYIRVIDWEYSKEVNETFGEGIRKLIGDEHYKEYLKGKDTVVSGAEINANLRGK